MKLAVTLLLGLSLGGALLFAQRNLSSPQEPIQGKQRQERIKRNQGYGMNGAVKGRVVLDDGSPASGFVVTALFQQRKTGGEGEGDAVTDSKGNFIVEGLGKDQFYVIVSNEGKPYVVPRPAFVDLRTNTSVSVPDLHLKLGPLVTVRVKNAETGQPVPGLVASSRSHGSPQEAGVKTNANGEASFRTDRLEFILRVEDEDKIRGYGPAPGYALMKEIKLSGVEPVVWETLVYKNGGQRKAAVFTGVVVDTSGNPVGGATVNMQRDNEYVRAISDTGGRFELKTVRIRSLEDPVRSAAVMANKGNIRAFRVVSAAETWNGIRMVLGTEPRVLVTGRLIDQRGRPLNAARILYLETFGVDVGSNARRGTFYTKSDGTFTFDDFHVGADYTFSFGSFYEGNKRLGVAQVPEKSSYLLTADGWKLGSIVVPTADRVVEGILTDQEGRPVTKDVMLLLKGKYTSRSAFPDKNGSFKFEAAVDEPLSVWVFGGVDGGYRTGADSPDLFLKMNLGPSQNKLKLSVKLRPVKP